MTNNDLFSHLKLHKRDTMVLQINSSFLPPMREGVMMKKSTQHKLSRVRAPRVQITYDVESGDAITQKELPFVVGVIADLAPGAEQSAMRLRERSFTTIDSASFDSVMGSIRPTLTMRVRNHLDVTQPTLPLKLQFEHMDAFSPDAIAAAVPQLAALLQTRARLNDLLAKLEGNDALNDLLAEVVSSTQLQERAEDELKARGLARAGEPGTKPG